LKKRNLYRQNGRRIILKDLGLIAKKYKDLGKILRESEMIAFLEITLWGSDKTKRYLNE